MNLLITDARALLISNPNRHTVTYPLPCPLLTYTHTHTHRPTTILNTSPRLPLLWSAEWQIRTHPHKLHPPLHHRQPRNKREERKKKRHREKRGRASRGLLGLANLSVTCIMNSPLQCLASTRSVKSPTPSSPPSHTHTHTHKHTHAHAHTFVPLYSLLNLGKTVGAPDHFLPADALD
jgi:hypothetical protein